MFRKRASRIRGIAGSLDGRRVLVVGAAHDAGPGIMRVIAEAGAVVYATATDSPTLDVELSRLGNTPSKVHPVVADPSTPPGRDELLALIAEPIDAMVINPAMAPGTRSTEWAMALVKSVATSMQDRGHAGSIVVVTGIPGLGPSGSEAAFLQVEIETLAAEFAPNAIRVNAVAMGPVGATRRGNPRPSRVSPLGHVSLHPVEIGKAVWFLINDDLSLGITGTTLKIDRGASLLRPQW